MGRLFFLPTVICSLSVALPSALLLPLTASRCDGQFRPVH
nr:MAG TPA: hypothetical protein [Caudoviricetes sp.]